MEQSVHQLSEYLRLKSFCKNSARNSQKRACCNCAVLSPKDMSMVGYQRYPAP